MVERSLFSDRRGAAVPLAERLRPKRIDDILGQDHLLGVDRPLRLAIQGGRPHSMILWGPPGVGKTTLARLLADAFQMHFIAISAVLGGIKEIREAVERAQATSRGASGGATLVFVDEVHRFNKAQQDAFLPHVETGLFTFVGATTENPSFEVNSALLSRATVYVLRRLDPQAMRGLAKRACKLSQPVLELEEPALGLLIDAADGDGRRLLNLLETLERSDAGAPAGTGSADPAQAQGARRWTLDDVAARLGDRVRVFDQGGDAFYDQISALHKSVRGSHPNAALYWLARMLDGGADPRYLARRIVRMAAEDIGLADPRALRLALDAAQTWERLGSPEGDLALANAVAYLAVAPKSNAIYTAWKEVTTFVKNHQSAAVPVHLRNAPTKLMTELGYGRAYRYAHDEPDAYAAGESYMPDGLPEPSWYQPTERGLEGRIREKIEYLQALDEAYRNRKTPERG